MSWYWFVFVCLMVLLAGFVDSIAGGGGLISLPAYLIDEVKVDVGHMKIGDMIHVRDLPIASDENIKITTDLDAIVATVAAIHNVVPEETTPAETTEKTE